MSAFFRLRLPATAAATARRPPDLAYASTERPPALAFTGLALQHAATALAFIAYALAIAQIGGLDTAATQAMVTATILTMAVGTFLQSWGGPGGSGLLLVNIPDPLIVATAGLILAHYGAGSLILIGIVHGLVALAAAYLVPRLRVVLSPAVAGVVICVAGISLIAPGLTQITALDAETGIDHADFLIAAATLGTIISLSIWGTQRGKLFALLAGLLIGLGLAAFLGRLQGMPELTDTGLFGLPRFPGVVIGVDPGMLVAIGMLSLMAQLDAFGCVVLMHKMNDADWRRPNMALVSGGIRANAIANLFGACFGAQPTGSSSANIALSHISRTTSRYVGLATACVLALCAFLPKVALALTLIPTPVVGAVGLYAAAYLMVSGLELITSRALDSRAIFMVGLALTGGIGVMLLPELALAAPESVRFLAGNGIVVAGVIAITLNLVFRLGTSQRASEAISHDGGTPVAHQIVNFVESHGAHWNARRDAISRAASACLEGYEALQAAHPPSRLTHIRGSFDEFNLDFELLHDGPPLALDRQAAPAPENLLDLDDEEYASILDRNLENLSHTLLLRLADRISSGRNAQSSWLRLHFDH